MPKKFNNKFVEGLMVDIENHFSKNTTMKGNQNFTLNEKGSLLTLKNVRGHLLRTKFLDIKNVIDTATESLDYVISFALFSNEIIFFGGNSTYTSIITSARIDEQGNFYERMLWRGNMEWNVDTKITAVTNWENENAKRVYFTDGVNSISSINISRDELLTLWGSDSSDLFINAEYIIPSIDLEVKAGGSLPVMVSQYTGRYISKNGSTTDFFPLTGLEVINIGDNNDPSAIQGGFEGNNSGKFVDLYVFGIDVSFSQLEIYAVEYENKNTVTKIALLGKKDIDASSLDFTHNGSEVSSTIDVSQVIKKTDNISFENCNSLAIKDNILIAGGLRNASLEESSFDSKITSWNPLTGGKSAGYDTGNGIEIQVIPIDVGLVNGDGYYADKSEILETPYVELDNNLFLRKTLQRGETYRLGIEWTSISGNDLFNQHVVDAKIPTAKDKVSYTLDGVDVVDDKTMQNTWQEKINDIYRLNVRYVNLVVRVRIPVEFRDKMSGFRITHVERTNYNSTILDQGIVHPSLCHWIDYGGDNYKFFGKSGYNFTPGLNHPYYEEASRWRLDNGGDVTESYRNTNLVSYDSPKLVFEGESFQLNNPEISLEYVEVVSGLDKDFIDDLYTKASSSAIKGGDVNEVSMWHYTLFSSVDYDVVPPFYAEPKSKILKNRYLVSGEQIDSIDMGIPSLIDAIYGDKATSIINKTLSFRKDSPIYPFLSTESRHYQQGSGYSMYENNMGNNAHTLFMSLEQDFWNLRSVLIKDSKDAAPKKVTTQRYIGNIVQALENQYEEDAYGASNERYISSSGFIKLNSNLEYENIVEGDRYMTLFNHLKAGRQGEHARGGSLAKGFAFGVVLESSIPFELNTGHYFNRDGINLFSMDEIEMNEAFLTTDSLVSYRNKPFNFEEITNLKNIIAASKVKVSGEYYDAWSEFPVFDFHELDKDKGDVTNISVNNDLLHVIQQEVVSIIGMNSRAMITPSDGRMIQMVNGTGEIFEYHENIYNKGTSFRNNYLSTDYGTFFISEDHDAICLIKGKSVVDLLNDTNNKNLLLGKTIVDFSLSKDTDETEIYFSLLLSESIPDPTEIEIEVITELTLVYSTRYKNFTKTINRFFKQGFNFNKRLYHVSSLSKLYEFGIGGRNVILDGLEKSKLAFVINPEPNSTNMFNNFIGYISGKRKINNITFTDNEGRIATITNTDRKYRIRENKHLIPIRSERTINESIAAGMIDRTSKIRGEWVYCEIEFDFSEEHTYVEHNLPSTVITEVFWCEDKLMSNITKGQDVDSGDSYLEIPSSEFTVGKVPTDESVIEIGTVFLSNPIVVSTSGYIRLYDERFRDFVDGQYQVKFNGCGSLGTCGDVYDEAYLTEGNLYPPVTEFTSVMEYDHTVDNESLIVVNMTIPRVKLASEYEIEYNFNGEAWTNSGIFSFNCEDSIEEVFKGGTALPYAIEDGDVTLNLRIRSVVSLDPSIGDSEWFNISVTKTAYEVGHYSQTSCDNNC